MPVGCQCVACSGEGLVACPQCGGSGMNATDKAAELFNSEQGVVKQVGLAAGLVEWSACTHPQPMVVMKQQQYRQPRVWLPRSAVSQLAPASGLLSCLLCLLCLHPWLHRLQPHQLYPHAL